jgi:dTMP kinase
VTRGAFIVIEGIDGSGKTTMANRLARQMTGARAARYTREPYGATLNVWLQLSPNATPHESALAFAADRLFHVRHCIRPAVAEGEVVICDRYVWSSLAYQGADGCDTGWLREINRHAPEPDFTVYLDVQVEAAVDRIERRERRNVSRDEWRRLGRVAGIYDSLAANADVKRAIVIDADREEDAVFADVLAAVTAFLETFDGGKPL